MTDTTLSPREREILDAVSRTDAVGFDTLATYFENRMPADELRVVLDRLKERRLVGMYDGSRTAVVIITREGRRVAREKRRG